MNNSSLLTADRTTHLKIVVVSLVFATLVAAVGVTARITDGKMGFGASFQAAAPVIKVSKPVTASANSDITVR
jgi:hypothetical protein